MASAIPETTAPTSHTPTVGDPGMLAGKIIQLKDRGAAKILHHFNFPEFFV